MKRRQRCYGVEDNTVTYDERKRHTDALLVEDDNRNEIGICDWINGTLRVWSPTAAAERDREQKP
jgi:hypothetical protein